MRLTISFPILSVGAVDARCRRYTGPAGVPIATMRVRGFHYVIPDPGGHASFGVLFDHKHRPGTAYRSVRTSLGSGATALGVKLRRWGLVVIWPGGGPYSPSTPPRPEEPADGTRIVAQGKLICRDLHDNISSYFVNGHGRPYLEGVSWRPGRSSLSRSLSR